MKIKNEEPTDEELIAMRKELINMLSSMTVPELREFLYLDID